MTSLVASRAGLFVGGRASRMGGVAKGLLPHPETGEPLVLRLARLCREAGIERVSLVGRRPPYEGLGLPVIDDAPGMAGPLGGLVALLENGGGPALALACDMPFVSVELVRRLATERPEAPALAARLRGAPFEPLVARYAREAAEVARALADEGERSLQRLLRSLQAHALELDGPAARELRDWDSPTDLG